MLSFARSCPSSICPGHLSAAWLVSHVVFSCRMVSKWWHVRPIGRLWGGCCSLPRTTSCIHIADYIYDIWQVSHPNVGLSIIVCDVEHTSFHFGMCGRNFVLCLFGDSPSLCTIYHSWQLTRVVHLSLQADGKVAFEEIPVFGICHPSCQILRCTVYLFRFVSFRHLCCPIYM